MDSSNHAQHCIAQFVCRRSKTMRIHSLIKPVYGDNLHSVQQCLTGARDSKRVGAALRTLSLQS